MSINNEQIRLICILIFVIASFKTFHAASANEVEEEDESNSTQEVYNYLTEEDFAAAAKLKSSDLYQVNTPGSWTKSGHFHGDIKGKAVKYAKSAQTRNGVRQNNDKWYNGVIPYVLSSRYSRWERSIIARAMNAYHRRTCVRFVRRDAYRHRNYLYIGKIDGCFSDVGRAGGYQELSLGRGCLQYDTVIHELMHAVGFWHEHERWDRDSFINIVWRNVAPNAYDQFGRVNLYESAYYGESYDYLSIMHYDSKSFTRNGGNTMVARNNRYTYLIGRVKDFSRVDLRKINKMYNCWNRNRRRFRNTRRFNNNRFNNRRNSGSGCRDIATQCKKWLYRCKQKKFQSVMQEFCRSSCGFCKNR